jgi:WD40 repeat protein
VFRGSIRAGTLAAATAALCLCPTAAKATFPGANGKIAFTTNRDGNDEIYTMNPDGSAVSRLTTDPSTDADPAWSPDGQKIAFTSYRSSRAELWTMNADGTGQTKLTTSSGSSQPAWSPEGTRVAYIAEKISLHIRTLDGSSDVEVVRTQGCDPFPDPWPSYCDFLLSPDWSPDGSMVAYARDYVVYDPFSGEPQGESPSFGWVTPGTGSRRVLGAGFAPSWAPNQARIAFYHYTGNEDDGTLVSHVSSVRPDGTEGTRLADDAGAPAWSPDGSRIAFTRGGRIKLMDPDGSAITDVGEGSSPAWQPIPINAYPRPRGATPMRLPLVPAQKPCTAPNNTHGAPLSFGSCSPAELSSQYLTAGTPDANGRGAHMDAYLLLSVLPADVKIDAHLTDIMKKDLSDYTGSLHANLPLRITDRNNTPSPGGPGAATTQPFAYGMDIPCTTNGNPVGGSNCTLSTTVNALAPGAVQAGLRAIWQIGQARIFDGGSDADGSTTADNTVFAVQGVFVP